MKTEMQYRKSEEMHSSDDMVIEGYAIIFDSPTTLFTDMDGVDYKEVVTAGAFDECPLDNVLLRYNHNDNVPILARTGNGSLKLEIDGRGLKLQATLANTQQGKDIYELVKRGDLSALSIGFIVGKNEFRGNTNYILSIDRLVEISIVDNPAYHDTSVYALRDEIKAEKEQELLKIRKLLLLKTY